MQHFPKKGKENLICFLGLDIYTLRISGLSPRKKERFGGLEFTRLLALKREARFQTAPDHKQNLFCLKGISQLHRWHNCDICEFHTDGLYFTMTSRRVCWKVGVVNW